MAIFKFNPIFKSLIWGGEKIAPFKGVQTNQKNIGESWELSGVAGSESVVAEGSLKGYSLPKLIDHLKEKLVGKENYKRFGNEFPLLIKFIDAREELSIQVHPDDKLSGERHGKKGKTEMWYVVDNDPGAKLRSGFSTAITPEEYEQRIANSTITDVLSEFEVNKGDLFFLPAGRIHSIGAGCFIAEIQQTSDVTYRIYDFNRTDADGNTRELHTELSKDAINYTVSNDYKGDYTAVKNEAVQLVSCDYFTTHLYDIDTKMKCDYSEIDSFVVLMCVEGEVEVMDNDASKTTLKQGSTALIPATTRNITLSPKGNAKLLTSYIG